jgi:thioredoxin:protein disulfide reductase
MRKIILFFTLLFCAPLLYAAQPVPIDQAFALATKISADQHSVIASWQIAPGYHLYRDRFSFAVTSNNNVAQLNAITLPKGINKEDNILGKYEVYEKNVSVNIPFSKLQTGLFTLTIRYQGCASANFCYPPVSKQIQLSSNGSVITLATVAPTLTIPEQDKVTKLLAGNNWWLILLGFLGFGLLLAFTPCVLPMIPILSGIILGQEDAITVMRAFGLSLTYVLAMAITYAAAGVTAGLAGSYVQAFFQNPWMIGIFCAIFVLLALSLFGLYELRLPNFLHHHVTKISNKQSSGNYIGVAVMGCLSTLIVSPCVTAPLIGALSYIGKTGNAVLGGTALFTMGLGMGIPLMIIGTLGGEFLPKAGPWMNTIKAIFGVLLLGVAIVLLGRIVSANITMWLWAALLIVTAIYMGALTTKPKHHNSKLWKALSLILLVYGFLLLIGASMGNTDPLQPLAIKQAIPVANQSQSSSFQIVNNLSDAERALANAKQQNKPALLDFYADWCVSCKEMDAQVFNDLTVQRKLANYVLIRADVTSNDEAVQALEKHFNVIAPPTMIFFNKECNEITNSRIVGAVSANDFLNHLQQCAGK